MQKHSHGTRTFVGLLCVLGAASAVMAQAPSPSPPTPQAFQVPHTAMASPDFVYLSAGPMWEEKTVIDSPYSAEAVSESRQVLADGNVIDHKETSRIYRDSAGRVRRETDRVGMLGIGARVLGFAQAFGEGAQEAGAVTLRGNAGGPEVTVGTGPAAGGQYFFSTQTGPGGKTLSATGSETISSMDGKRITIDDPVAHIAFLLDPARKIAYKMLRPPPDLMRFQVMMRKHHALVEQPNMAGILEKQRTLAARKRQAEPEQPNVTSQSLGTRTFDGVMAYGSRSTMVIPAGAIGNEKAINVVSDRWYSPKLQTSVMTRRDDPRFGVITYRLMNVKRGEPSEALFEVPPGYTIKSLPLKPRNLERRQAPPN